MRTSTLIAAAVSLAAALSLAVRAAADVTVEVPGALGAYVAGDAGRVVTVYFGEPLVAVHDLRVRWEGTGTAGLAAVAGQEPVPWYGWLCCRVAQAEPTDACALAAVMPVGAFALEASFEAATGYDFLADGIMEAGFTFGENPAVAWDDLAVLVAPECTLDRVTVIADLTVPAADTTWGAVKRLYGR